MAILAGGTIALLLSLIRLHRQLLSAKKVFVRQARDLHAVAYSPLRVKPSLKTLRARAPELSAAEALVRRAEAIQEWPFDEAILGRAVVIITSVAAALIARLIIGHLGL
jgi:hypothetical protein